MATTTNFGWETPDDTDLVKDGALAIRTLGSAIDTSLVDLKGGTTGQVLSKTSNTDMDFTWVTSDDANAIQNAIVDAKGDLITATAADTPARLGVGTNNQSLIVDSTTSTGLKWGNTPALGGMSPINVGGTALTGAATITISGITAMSRICVIVEGASSASANSYMFLRFNGNSQQVYGYAGLYLAAVQPATTYGAFSLAATSIPLARQGGAAGDTCSSITNIIGTFDTGMYQVFHGSNASGTTGNPETYSWASGFFNGSAAISSVSVISNTGNFDAGTIYVWGI